MPAIASLSDMSMGHCFGARGNLQASENCFINGKPIHLFSHWWPTHVCPPAAHDSITSKGSENVLVNGLPIARISDELDCGDMIAEGSSDCFAN